MAKSEDEIRKQMEGFCQRVLAGAKLVYMDKAAMDAAADTKGKYDQGYRVATAQQGMRNYTLTFNPTSDRIDVVYH